MWNSGKRQTIQKYNVYTTLVCVIAFVDVIGGGCIFTLWNNKKRISTNFEMYISFFRRDFHRILVEVVGWLDQHGYVEMSPMHFCTIVLYVLYVHGSTTKQCRIRLHSSCWASNYILA